MQQLASIVRSELLYAPSVKRQFKKYQHVVVPDAVPIKVCESIIASLQSGKFGTVDARLARFFTINGDDLISLNSSIQIIESELIEWVSLLAGIRYTRLDNRQIGISVNVMPPGCAFPLHRDRPFITLIVYLNCVEGGELNIYPGFRGRGLPLSVHNFRRRAISFLETSTSPLNKVLYRLIFRPVQVKPKTGTVVLFTMMNDHRVKPVARGGVRYALIISADHPGKSFIEVQDYYGYGPKENKIKELLTQSANI